ncbi:Rieske 2Fe-2S domain-containing protein [Pantanalinema sp. GBBB05]|uniref:QcrA and Rieske domain-containing protein n=1 Tax=Pantanalinema sp. GBBB05 TaxID=2604139 RepID=UPI001DCEB12F|nr:Rieske (2Fe-2S) protein [Pantanalinema sp. GBBB05]
MQRRDFLKWVGIGGLASYLPVAIVACSQTDEAAPTANLPAATPGADGFAPVGDMATLDKEGMLKAQISGKPAIVVRDPIKPNAVLAVNPTCTHKGCIVNWDASQKHFVCPCHGAEFSPDGKVLKDPAKQSLATYQAKVNGSQIAVKVS